MDLMARPVFQRVQCANMRKLWAVEKTTGFHTMRCLGHFPNTVSHFFFFKFMLFLFYHNNFFKEGKAWS